MEECRIKSNREVNDTSEVLKALKKMKSKKFIEDRLASKFHIYRNEGSS